MIRSWEKLDTNFDWISWTDEKARWLQYLLIQKAQNVVDTVVWHAAYQKGLSENMTEAQAIGYANDSVSATQSSPDVTSMANIQRGRDDWKLLTMVTSVPIAMNNLLQSEAMRDQTKANKAKALIVMGLFAAVLPSLLDGMMSELVDEITDKKEEDDEEEDNEALGVLALRTALGSLDSVIPVYTRPISSAIMFGAASASPGLSRLNKVAQASKAVKNGLNGVDLSSKEAASLMETLTILTGKPFAAVGRTILAENLFQDQDTLDERSEDRREQLALAREE